MCSCPVDGDSCATHVSRNGNLLSRSGSMVNLNFRVNAIQVFSLDNIITLVTCLNK